MYESYEQCRAQLYGATADGRVSAVFYGNHCAITNCASGTLGVRTPVVKRLAKLVPMSSRDDVMRGFFESADRVYETTLFAGLLAARKGDYNKTREYMKRLVPLFDSWAHSDTIVPCLRWADADDVLRDFAYLKDCDGQYEVRTYIIILLTRCLTPERIDFALDVLANGLRYGDYYVDMAAAWCIAEALVKQYDKTLPILKSGVLPTFVHNKAVQKARESFRISDGQKRELAALRLNKD